MVDAEGRANGARLGHIPTPDGGPGGDVESARDGVPERSPSASPGAPDQLESSGGAGLETAPTEELPPVLEPADPSAGNEPVNASQPVPEPPLPERSPIVFATEAAPEAAPQAAVQVDPTLRFVSQLLTIVAVLALGFLTQLALLGGLQHDRDQAQAFRELRVQLAIGTAPVGPTGLDGNALPSGTPVAILEIPRLSLQEVVLEGTSSRVLMSGVGHRRDTVLPGQAGASVILGRRGGYGGSFGEIGELRPGDEIVVTTGQGRHTFAALGVRRAGDPLPSPRASGGGRLTLATADGPRFRPTGVLWVDADLTSPTQLAGPQIPTRALPSNEPILARDTAALLPLMLWGPLLVGAAVGIVWVRHRTGRWQAWIIGIPVLILLGVIVIDIAAALLPNVV